MEGGTLLERLYFAATQADARLNAPHLTDGGRTLSLGAFSGGENDLLLAFNFIAVEEPRSGALDEVAVVALDNLFEEAGDLGLGGGLRGSSLGLLLIGSGSEQARRKHQSEEQLVGIVCGEHEVGGAAGDFLVSLAGNDGVADNRTEAIDLGAELDLDGLAGLKLDGSLGLIGLERSVRSNVGGRRHGARVCGTCKGTTASA